MAIWYKFELAEGRVLLVRRTVLSIVVLQLKRGFNESISFCSRAAQRWGIPELQLQQLLLGCNDLLVSSWSQMVDDDSKQVSFFGFFFFQRTKLIHTSRRSTPTTFVSQTTTGSSSILYFRIICVCVYLKVNYTTGTIYFRGFLVAFHFCLKGNFLFTLCIIALIHFTLLKGLIILHQLLLLFLNFSRFRSLSHLNSICFFF